MKIRHAINLTTKNNAVTSNNSDERVYFDPTVYNGTITCYVEVLVSSFTSSSTVSLRNSIGDISGSTFSITSTGLFSSSGFTISAAGEYSLGATGANVITIKSATLIIIQDTGSDPLNLTQAQICIGNYETGKTNVTASPLNSPKYWTYDSSSWDGSAKFYAEVIYFINSNMTTTTIVLQEDDGNFGTWTTKATIVNAGSSISSGGTRVRTSSTFTPTSGRHYRIAGSIASNMFTYDIYTAYIIVTQTGRYPTTYQNSTLVVYGGTGGSGINQAVVQSFQSSGGTITGASIYIDKVGSPTDNVTVDIQSSIGGSSLVGGAATIALSSLTVGLNTVTFNTPLAAISGNTYYLYVTRSGGRDTSNYPTIGLTTSDLYASGVYYIVSNGSAASQSTDLLFRIIGDAYDNITKLEEQYLIANTSLAAGTSLQNFLVKWDSSQWSGVSNTYFHQVDASDNNTSVVEVDTSSGTQLTNSIVSYPDNSEDSSYDDSYFRVPFDTSNNISNGTSTKSLGQSFTSNGGTLDKAVFYVYKVGSPTGNCVAKIYSHSGTFGSTSLPSTLLATSDTIDVSTLTTSTSGERKTFTFSGAQRITLSASTNYVVAFEYTGGDASNYVKVSSGVTSLHPGNGVALSTSTSTWSSVSSDTHFGVWLAGGKGITMPSNQNLDIKATTNSGSIYASRILVKVTKATVTLQPINFGFIIGG